MKQRCASCRRPIEGDSLVFVCPHCGAESGAPEDPDFDYDNVIKVAKEMWGDPYDGLGEYKPEMISAAIAEIERRKEAK